MSWVYFIRPIGMQGPVKIGCSVEPETRRKCFEANSPYELEIVAKMIGDQNLERRFHAKFKASHLRKEWFTWSHELEDVIAAIKGHRFDVSTLPCPELVTYRPKPKTYITPQWRYRISATRRVEHIRYKGRVAWDVVKDFVAVLHSIDDMSIEEMEAHKPSIERSIAELKAKYLPSYRPRHTTSTKVGETSA